VVAVRNAGNAEKKVEWHWRQAEKYVNETVGLIDVYVERVINMTENYVGRCEPLSRSYNATVIAVCNEIVDSFNGFWASIGWCYLFFLPSIALAITLVSLYRKSEAYPGPLVEAQPDERLVVGAGKKKKRGHRRNPSEYLPDSAHYRAGYSYQVSNARKASLRRHWRLGKKGSSIFSWHFFSLVLHLLLKQNSLSSEWS
jgi:Prominin